MAFDRKWARSLLETCRYTYAAGFNDALNAPDRKDALTWIKAAGELTQEPKTLRANATSVACVVSYTDKNVVAYMGTKTQFDKPENAVESVADWVKNVEAPQVPFRLTADQLGLGSAGGQRDLGGRVHAGFLEELAAVQGSVVEELMKAGGKARPLYVTGHSQGGAEAALATPAFLAGGFAVAETYTFAAPRAGNVAFVATVPAAFPVHRIEFGDDIVPHVPPKLLDKSASDIAGFLRRAGFLGKNVNALLDYVLSASGELAFRPLGRLCYGSNKTKALRVDLSDAQDAELFYDRVWSLARHPDRWAEHHHLAGTSDETAAGAKGNYTALVSDFTLVEP